MLRLNAMDLPASSATPHPLRNRAAGSLMLLVTLATGCASPGNPRPPSLNLPALVTDLTAQRVGDQVQLHWTTPSRTTDGLELKGALTAEFCRQTGPSAPCDTITRLPVQPGPSQAADALRQPLTQEPATLLAYRIQIVNASERSAGLSEPAYTAAGTAPPPVAHLHASAARDGITLEWEPQSASSPATQSHIELQRILTPPATKPDKAPSGQPSQPSPLQLSSPAPTRVHLLTGATSPDAGGTLDRSVSKGETYTYTAQRLRSVRLNGHALELHSVSSSPVTLLFTDKFSPAPPTGLASVPDDTPPHTSIDLSWESNTENDLAGYAVYRQELSAAGQPLGNITRLTPTPVVGPAFRDLTAIPGHRYAYTVSAIDTAGNESSPSAGVQEIIREP